MNTIKKALTIFFILNYFQTYSQNTITGIGKFKINITDISIIDSLIKESSQKSFILKQIIKDTTYYYNDFYSTEYPNIKVFKIENYEIAGFKIPALYLNFEKLKLIKIEFEIHIELFKLLKLKYPNFKTYTKTVLTNCVTGGLKDAEFGYDYEITTRWTNGKTACKIVQSYYYNSDCELKGSDNCEIYALPYRDFSGYDRKMEKLRELRKEKEKLKKLKDL